MVILMVQKNSYKKLKKNILLNSKKYFFEKLEKFSNREAIITEDSKIITYKSYENFMINKIVILFFLIIFS